MFESLGTCFRLELVDKKLTFYTFLMNVLFRIFIFFRRLKDWNHQMIVKDIPT